MVVEKRELIGGSTAKSGGAVWIPNNPLMVEEGVADSYDEAMAYFEEVIGDVGPASSHARRHAYLTRGPEMVSFLRDQGLVFRRCEGWSDYYSGAAGGKSRGRAIEAEILDGKELGPWLDKVQESVAWEMLGLALYVIELNNIVNFNRSAKNFVGAGRIWLRTKLAGLRGQVPMTQGWALVGQLLNAALRAEIPISTSTAVRDLIVEDGRVAGVVVRKDGRDRRIEARRGVLLAAGGFAHNAEMREKYLDPGGAHDWSRSNPGDTGEIMEMAMSLGAATSLMDEAIWTPAKLMAGVPVSDLDRFRPGSIIVDSGGRRFCNEANSYQEVGQKQLARNHITPAVPAWLIFDDAFRRRYVFKKGRPGVIPEAWFEDGTFKRAESLEALAGQCGIDPAGLSDTVERFNPEARAGRDPEFNRGVSASNHHHGDPHWGPNNSLGPIERAPFYATAIYPADVGTSGGLLADEHARVLNEAGDPIPGLYVCGNNSASVMGRTYLGAGASIGNSTVFGYIAALHASGQ